MELFRVETLMERTLTLPLDKLKIPQERDF
jgi:hypothetical protein